jgi:O-antigen/teichoic acid export membrane protein
LGLAIVDQGLTSGSGFLLNLLLARWLSSEAYGAFAVAFATLLFVAGFHSVLLLEPMSVFGPADYSHRLVGYFIAQLKLHAVLVGALSGALLLASAIMARLGVPRELVAATVGSAIALPFLLLFWLARRMCYVVHQPAIAVWGSAGYFGFVVIGLIALREYGRLNPLSAFLLVGAASVVPVLLLLRRLGLFEAALAIPCPWKQVLRENWGYGRWLVASTTLFTMASQTQTYLAAAFLGLSAAGILRAMQVPSLVMTQIITAVGLLLLPSMSSDFGLGRTAQLRRKATLATVSLTAMAAGFAVVLWAFAKPIEQVLFGGKFSAQAWLIPILGIVPVCTALATGLSMALRASQKPHFDLVANAVAAPVGVLTAVIFIGLWGLGGAALSLVAGFATYAAVYFYSFKRWAGQDQVLKAAQ